MASFAVVAAFLALALRTATAQTCPGNIQMPGFGQVSMIPTGWHANGAPLEVLMGNTVQPHMGSRAYFAETCTAGTYDHNQYLALSLLGKRFSFTVDLSGAGCGCNAAIYLVSMRQNDKVSSCSDYYCDANSVCGVACTEIDLMEANNVAWHSTLHAWNDKGGVGKGNGGGGPAWNGPRDWPDSDYGLGGRCVDTQQPFDVNIDFRTTNGAATGPLQAMVVELTQAGKPCTLKISVDSYSRMSELSAAMAAGMTPVVSYWSNADMLWMDGKGQDQQGPCATDTPSTCSATVKYSNFKVSDIGQPTAPQAPPVPKPTPAPAGPPVREIVLRLDPVDLPPGFQNGADVTVQFGDTPLHAQVVAVGEWGAASPRVGPGPYFFQTFLLVAFALATGAFCTWWAVSGRVGGFDGPAVAGALGDACRVCCKKASTALQAARQRLGGNPPPPATNSVVPPLPEWVTNLSRQLTGEGGGSPAPWASGVQGRRQPPSQPPSRGSSPGPASRLMAMT